MASNDSVDSGNPCTPRRQLSADEVLEALHLVSNSLSQHATHIQNLQQASGTGMSYYIRCDINVV